MPRLALLCGLLAGSTLPAADDGFTPLFNGRDLDGWTFFTKDAAADPKKLWAVKDGAIACTGTPFGYIATANEYGDYELRLMYRYPADAKAGNSGVLLHCGKADRIWPNSVEAQTRAGRAGDFWLNANDAGRLPRLDADPARFDTKDKNKRHYFRIEPKEPVEKPFGEWNEYRISCRGGAITLVLNGVKVNEAADGELKRGRIALQAEGTPVEFKDIRIKSLK
jgi:hypothetical protein